MYFYMHEEKIKRLYNLKKLAEGGGGPEKVEAQHSKGKLTARERIDILLDTNTFVEIDKYVTQRSEDATEKKYYGDGVVTGFGYVNGRQVFVYAYDFTILGGSLGEMAGRKVSKDRKSTRLNSSHVAISYAVFCLKKQKRGVQRDVVAVREIDVRFRRQLRQQLGRRFGFELVPAHVRHARLEMEAPHGAGVTSQAR